jgi:NAD(P)-dependent dehydrogenase (short-subunit alcohol dehydrogenase family)
MFKTAVITGAGTGVGRAIALALAAENAVTKETFPEKLQWRVALVGRRFEMLQETASLMNAGPDRVLLCAADVGKVDDVDRMAVQVLGRWPDVDALINAAGTNAPRRALEVLSREDYRAILETNLDGAYYCVQAFLPGMRRRKSGTIINIVSDAGKQANPKAGPAYVASKFGLLGLTQSINVEERVNGVRACAILPGDINTPILDKRPVPPSAEARQKMMQPEDIAACALLALNLPPRAVIEELIIRPG